MAYRMSAIDESCFSETLFALARVGCGHGEDTLLSRRIGSRGKLHMMHQVILDHPNLDPPKAYATHAFRMAWGTAYSRRLINDDYRWPNRPIFSDRWALAKSHAGTSLIHAIAAIRRPRLHRFSYAAGYACGAVYAWIRPPDARHLAPGIRWRDDAAAALGSMIHL